MSLTETPLAGAALANRTDGPWTDNLVELLKTMHADGLSGSQIAAELGMTRNAVIGKKYRLGLEPRRAQGGPDGMPRPKPQTRLIAKALRKRLVEAKEKPAAEVVPEPENIIPLGQRCSLLELDDTNCHWPSGDPCTPDFFFCGGTAPGELPYCAYHCAVAYQSPAARRDHRPRI